MLEFGGLGSREWLRAQLDSDEDAVSMCQLGLAWGKWWSDEWLWTIVNKPQKMRPLREKEAKGSLGNPNPFTSLCKDMCKVCCWNLFVNHWIHWIHWSATEPCGTEPLRSETVRIDGIDSVGLLSLDGAVPNLANQSRVRWLPTQNAAAHWEVVNWHRLGPEGWKALEHLGKETWLELIGPTMTFQPERKVYNKMWLHHAAPISGKLYIIIYYNIYIYIIIYQVML